MISDSPLNSFDFVPHFQRTGSIEVIDWNSSPKETQEIQHVPPQLFIIEQKADSEEIIFSNGIQKKVHHVIKNHPLQIRIGTSDSMQFSNLAYFNFEYLLVFEDDPFKEVPFVQKKPLEVKSQVSSDGSFLNLEVKISVLTSKLEASLFQIQICPCEPSTRTRLEDYLILSEPIKVVSKIDPKRLKKREKPSTPIIEQAPVKKMKDRDSENTNVIEILNRIEKVCALQQSLLSKVVERPPRRTDSNQKFLIAFQKFMEAAKQIDHTQMLECVRRLLRNTFNENVMNQLLYDFSLALQEKIEAEENSACPTPPCFHLEELGRIDQVHDLFLNVSAEISM